MCDITKGFKLCTCNEVDENKTHWKLLRFEDGISMVIGELNPDFYEKLKNYD